MQDFFFQFCNVAAHQQSSTRGIGQICLHVRAEVEQFMNYAIIWQPSGTYCFNMAISALSNWNFLSPKWQKKPPKRDTVPMGGPLALANKFNFEEGRRDLLIVILNAHHEIPCMFSCSS